MRKKSTPRPRFKNPNLGHPARYGDWRRVGNLVVRSTLVMEVTSLFSGAPWPAANGLARWDALKRAPTFHSHRTRLPAACLNGRANLCAIRPNTPMRVTPAGFKSGNYV